MREKKVKALSSLLGLPGLVGQTSLELEGNFIYSTRASRGSEKMGILPTIQERVSRNRGFRL